MQANRSFFLQFNRFLVSGTVNTALSYAVYLVLLRVTSYELAYIASYILGLGFGYYLNSRWVFFKSSTKLKIALYPIAYLPQLIIGTLLLRLISEGLGVPPSLSAIFVIILSVPINFLAVRWVMHQNYTPQMLWHKLQLNAGQLTQPKIIFLWLISSATVALFLGYHPKLEITLRSAGGQMQLTQIQPFTHSTESRTQQVLSGSRTVVFYPSNTLARSLVLDTSSFTSSVELQKVDFLSFGLRAHVKSASINRETDQTSGQSIIRIKIPLIVTIFGMIPWLFTGIFLFATIKLWPRRLDGHDRVTGWAVAWVVFCFSVFVYQVVWSSAWLPLLDDWRYYSDGGFSLINERFDWMLISGNDTYFLTGQVFDWILLKTFNGNFLSVRVFGLVALAGFLSFAIALLLHFSRNFTAVALIFLSFCISSSGYWGYTGIAYHQMLPVLFFTWSLWYLTRISNPKSSTPAQLVVFSSLALAAGLSYISGPTLFISLGIASLVIKALQWFQARSEIVRNNQDGNHWGPALLTLSLVGLTTMLIQLGIVISRQGSLLEHSHASTTVLPTEARFWWFLAGLYGRVSGQPGTSVWLDLVILIMFLASLTFLACIALRRRLNAHQNQTLLIALACGLGGILYACMVSAGRSGLTAKDATSWAQIAVYAKGRFHYWWLAALLPIFFALTLEFVKINAAWQRRLAIPLILILVFFKFDQVTHDDPQKFKAAKQRESAGVDCVRTRWMEAQHDKSKRYDCPQFYPSTLNGFIRPIITRNLQPATELFQYRIKPSNENQSN
ncbi:GtrA family protein [Hydrogenophaga taeniospiralis]|uniref:GtrA family protein n=1 Tax=Hydrogenophaga taeniospiralis TaxID=65656 RepID=UPI001CFB9B80|nr:GtrA family protein [Hydrogenophaga taeniospiralis]UCU95906.1 GtrA family protein [Hydrogenophaga taeniospiralis]